MSWRRTKRRWRRKLRRARHNTLAVVVIVGAVLTAGAGVAAAVMYDPGPPPSTHVVSVPTRTDFLDKPKVTPYTPTLTEAMSRLSKANRPFNVLILGDSTTLDTYNGWHVLTFQWLADQVDRPWTLWQWNSDPIVAKVGYHEQPRDETGSGAILNVWNASAGGKDFSYLAANLDELVPPGQAFDVVIVNHGHNVAPERDYYSEGISLLDRLHKGRLKHAAIVMTEQNPERGDVLRIHDMRLINEFVTTYAEQHRLPVIDVYDAFEKQPDVENLIDPTSMRHPTPVGYRIWAEEAEAVLGDALPTPPGT